jgi:alcohol dehydrogenase class IV/protocatechuate 3,4-dioxygenase beta subunit
MSLAFTWQASPSRVTLRHGAVDAIADEVAHAGGSRALVIAGGPSVADGLQRVLRQLAERAVAVIDDAAQHVPADNATSAAARAREAGADIVVTIGGGSATGLGKAVAVMCSLPLIAIPTTYAGSEMTPVWGRTDGGRKVTERDDRALPVAVIYDPALYRGMPARLAGASGMNALAHCLEALWLPATSPMTRALAAFGVRQLTNGLPRVVADPDDTDAHAKNLVGACVAGLSFAQAGSGIHHRTCHVLGGGWNLPHAETHAVLLPHSTALVAAHSPETAQRLGHVMGGGDPAQRVFALLEQLDLPRSLAELGLPETALSNATQRVLAASRDDPLADEMAVREMLAAAYAGRPSSTSATEAVPVLTSDARATDRLRTAVATAVNRAHELLRELDINETELYSLAAFLTRVGQADEFMLLSDVTNTSILVDELTHAMGSKHATASNVVGPMYRPGAELSDTPAVIARIDQGDDALTLSGRVTDASTTAPLSGALIDIWQTNQAGLYDNQDPDQPPGNLRGVIRCDDQGHYQVRTVIPGPYRIASMNGPVYALLNTLGRHDNRPGHIHLRITAPAHQPLTTMLFMAGDAWLRDDVIGAVKPELVITPRATAANTYEAEFDVALMPSAQ